MGVGKKTLRLGCSRSGLYRKRITSFIDVASSDRGLLQGSFGANVKLTDGNILG